MNNNDLSSGADLLEWLQALSPDELNKPLIVTLANGDLHIRVGYFCKPQRNQPFIAGINWLQLLAYTEDLMGIVQP